MLIVVAAFGVSRTEPWLHRNKTVAEARETPPPPLLEYITFGHRRGVSAALWLQMLVWAGGKALAQGDPDVLDSWRSLEYFKQQGDMIIKLDPRFPDPYAYLALLLMWYSDTPAQALPYLEKAMKRFPDVWDYPFFTGFIYYRWLNEPKTAARYFIQAGKLPGVPSYVPLLGTKLLTQAQNSSDAVELLEGILATDPPDGLRKSIQKELGVLRVVAKVETAAKAFEAEHGKIPTIEELVSKGYLQGVPLSPSGRAAYVETDGSVKFRKATTR